MSKIFDALKKAKNDQVDKLFSTTKKENTVRVPKYFNTPPQSAQSKPEPAITEPLIERADDTSSEAANQNFAANEPATAPVPVQTAKLTAVPNHPQVTIRSDRGNLVVLDDRSPASEQFTILRAKLMVAAREKNMNAICITSSVMQEGKTFVSTNLALALAAESGRGAIIIDADLRKPSVHRAFGIKEVSGLADYLGSDRKNIDSYIIDTDKRLSVIPAGRIPSNPVRLLDSEKMKSLLVQLRARYDFVIIDAPPTAPLPDSDIISSMADGLLFVIRAGQTPLTIIQRSLKMLKKHRIVGTVLNGTVESPSYGYYTQGAKES